MRHGQKSIGHDSGLDKIQKKVTGTDFEDFVLDKSIFANIFEKDIRRVFIYKKAERLAKAIHLIAPAFAESMSLKNRMDAIALGMVDAAILPSGVARTALARELLALSSALSMARTGGLLSSMNADLVAREAHALLQEVAAYEEPRLFLDDAPTLSGIAKKALSQNSHNRPVVSARTASAARKQGAYKGHIKDTEDVDKEGHIKDRQEAIMSVIKHKQKASIKDISTIIRGVSEKTIQRELLALIAAGKIVKRGERRWSTYSLLLA
ncbi:MAG: hypothetical protein KGJ31_00705 [Patescibacteria group bacterium]|nr:hypothetical protein [Patescibacteria group bacterium]